MIKLEEDIHIYFVYKHTLPKEISKKDNDMYYIGITGEETPEKRWKNGGGYKYNLHFYRAIKKYGWNNFKHEILFSNLKQFDAENKEIELIALYDTTNPLKGYNHGLGGNGAGKLTEISKQKISEANSKPVICLENNKIYNSIKEASEETKSYWGSLSQCCNKRIKSCNNLHWMFLEEYNEKEKEIILKQPKKKTDRKVLCIEENKVYNRIKDAELEKNITGICLCCSGKTKSAGGYHWIYLEDFSQKEIDKKLKEGIKKSRRQVYCIEEKKVYNSIREAARIKGVSHNYIKDCCDGKQNTSANLHWIYFEDFSQEKIDDSLKKRCGREKPVRNLENNKIYNSAIEAAKIFHTQGSNITGCCKGRIKTAGKDNYGNFCHWEYA